MATLTKVVSGNLYVEEFDMLNYLWEITPNINDRVVLSSGWAILEHGPERVSMLTTMPTGDFVFQTKISHEPVALSDYGGIVIFSDNNNMIECQTYYNSAQTLNQYYTHIKVMRVKDLYTFYASKDAIKWEIIGASELPDAHKIGFFLEGPSNPSTKPFSIDKVALYKSNVLTFMNVFQGMRVQILNSARDIIYNEIYQGEDNKVFVDLIDIVLPLNDAIIRIYDESAQLLIEQTVDIFGGDIFDYQFNLLITVDNHLINPLEPYELGHIGIMGQEYMIIITNKDTQICQNRKLTVAEYSSYYRGSNFVKVALDNDGGPGEYKSSVNLPPILPDGVVVAWMKVDRDLSSEAPFFAREYKYKIIVE